MDTDDVAPGQQKARSVDGVEVRHRDVHNLCAQAAKRGGGGIKQFCDLGIDLLVEKAAR